MKKLTCLASFVFLMSIGYCGAEGGSLIVGAVDGQHVFSCGFKSQAEFRPTDSGCIVMLRAATAGAEQPASRSLPGMVASADSIPVLLRWRLDNGALWSMQFWAIPSGGGAKNGSMVRLPARLLGALDPEFGLSDPKQPLGSLDLEVVASLHPLAKAYDEASQSPGREIPHYDFLPGPNGDFALFIRAGSVVSRWQYMKASEDWILEESWPVDWAEPFYVHQNGQTYFLILQSGKVYAASTGQAGQNGIKQLDVAPKPIIALLFEPATGKAFAFGETFYLELKPGAEVAACENIRSQGIDMDSAMRMLVNCARVLRNQPAQ